MCALCVQIMGYYGSGSSMDTRDLHVHVSRAKRTRCYAEVVTFLRVNLGFDVLTKI